VLENSSHSNTELFIYLFVTVR